MSKIKQLCNQEFEGNKSFTFKATSADCVFIREKTENVSSVSLFLISNGSPIYLGVLFDQASNTTEGRKLLKGETYRLDVVQGSQLKDTTSHESDLKTGLIKVGLFWGAE